MPRHRNLEAKSGITPFNQTSEEHEATADHKRTATVYDAIAGRANAEGLIRFRQPISRYRDSTSHSTKSIPPEQALFRFKGRVFDGENDPYWANRYLTADQQLPDSDLLKAVHAYASDFYHKNVGEGAVADYRSMDETALLCCGILLEEMADEALGETGDLALTEGEFVVPEARTSGLRDTKGDRDKSTDAAVVVQEPMETTDPSESDSLVSRKSKRRKINHEKGDV